MMRVRACTIRCQCPSSCRRSQLSQVMRVISTYAEVGASLIFCGTAILLQLCRRRSDCRLQFLHWGRPRDPAHSEEPRKRPATRSAIINVGVKREALEFEKPVHGAAPPQVTRDLTQRRALEERSASWERYMISLESAPRVQTIDSTNISKAAYGDERQDSP